MAATLPQPFSTTDQQDITGLVPRRFILYLLMNELPGVRLTNSFWSLGATERDEIRQALKAAWKYCSLFSLMVALLLIRTVSDIETASKLGSAISNPSKEVYSGTNSYRKCMLSFAGS